MTTSELSSRDLRSLRYVEHFTVWLLRTSVTCCSNCRVIDREFNRAFGPQVEEAAKVFEQVLLEMSKGIRPITIGRPGHIELTHDELSLIAMFAAAQRRDEVRFRAHACWLMGHGRVDGLYSATSRLGEVLQQRGYQFMIPMDDESLSHPGFVPSEPSARLRVMHS